MSDLGKTSPDTIIYNAYTIQNFLVGGIKIPLERHRLPLKFGYVQGGTLADFLSTPTQNISSRHVIFLSQSQIAALPDLLVNNGWKDFFEAMYLLIQKKQLPKDQMSPQEMAEKKVNIPKAISILTNLLERDPQSTDPKVKALSLMFLGYFYHSGLGTEQNIEKSNTYLTQALKDFGVVEANYELSLYEADERKIIEYLETATEAGCNRALVPLAGMYRNQNLPFHDLAKSENLLSSALKSPECQAEAYLTAATRTYYAKKSNKSQAEAMSLLDKAVELGSSEAATLLGSMYLQGQKPDKVKAIKILEKGHRNRYGACSHALGVIYYNDKAYERSAFYLFKALRYGHTKPETLNLIQNLINSLDSVKQGDLRQKVMAILNNFQEKNQVSLFKSSQQPTQASSTSPEEIAQKNKAKYENLVSNLHKDVQERVRALDQKRTPENMHFIIHVAIPLFSEFNRMFDTVSDLVNRMTEENQKLTSSLAAHLILRDLDTYKHMLTQQYLEKLLDTYTSCSPTDIVYLVTLFHHYAFHEMLIEYFPPSCLNNKAKRKIINAKLIKLMMLCATMPREEYENIFPRQMIGDRYKTFIEDASNHLSTLVDNFVLSHPKQTSSQFQDTRILFEIAYCLVTFKFLTSKTQGTKFTPNSLDENWHSARAIFHNSLASLSKVIKPNHDFSTGLECYSAEDKRTFVKALKELSFNAQTAMTLFGASKNKKSDEALKSVIPKIEAAINRSYNTLFAAEIQTENERKAAELAQKEQDDARKQQEIRNTLWRTIQSKANTDCADYQKKLETTDMSTTKHAALAKLKAKMVEMNSLIQETADYTQAHNTHFQTLKKKFDQILTQSQSAEQYDEIAGTAIAEVETYRQDSINAKKELMEREALRLAEEAEKQKAIEAAQATRAASRADKQKEYQESVQSQDAPKPESSSSDDEASTLGAIASFKGKAAKQIFAFQQDGFAGNAVRILALINNATTFVDIVNNKEPGDNLHDLTDRDMTLPTGEKSPCYALRVNDQYRITFYWSNAQNKAYKVWFGDYHH